MSQTKTHSLLEGITNVVVGYFVALFAQLVFFPFFGINISLGSNALIGLLFTAVSLVRSYVLRRIFNRVTINGIKRNNEDA